MRKIFVEAAVAAALVSWVAAPAFAASPSGGSVSPSDTTTAWTGQTYTAGATATPAACGSGDTLCDHFSLSVKTAAAYWETHTGGAAVSIEWADATDNFDLYVYTSSGALAASSAALSSTSENAYVANATGTYTIVVVPTVVTASGYDGFASFSSEDKPKPSPSPSPSPTGGSKGGGSGSGGGTGGSGGGSGSGGTGGGTGGAGTGGGADGGSGAGTGTGGSGSGTGDTGGTTGGGTGDTTGSTDGSETGGSDTSTTGAGTGSGSDSGTSAAGGSRGGSDNAESGSTGSRPEPPPAGPTDVGQASGEIFNYTGPLFFPPPFTTAPAGSNVTAPQPQVQPPATTTTEAPAGSSEGTTTGHAGAPPLTNGGGAVQPPGPVQTEQQPGTIIRVEPASNRPIGVPNYVWVILPMALLMLAAVGAVIFEPETPPAAATVRGGATETQPWRTGMAPPPPPLVLLGFATRRMVRGLLGGSRRRRASAE